MSWGRAYQLRKTGFDSVSTIWENVNDHLRQVFPGASSRARKSRRVGAPYTYADYNRRRVIRKTIVKVRESATRKNKTHCLECR